MSGRSRVRQQTNSQTQAGAAAQLVVNIFLVSASDGAWVVKPIAFHAEGVTGWPAGTGLPLGPAGADGAEDGKPEVELEMEAGRRSNAQGQGLTVSNQIDFPEVLARAIVAAAGDQDIQQALSGRR